MSLAVQIEAPIVISLKQSGLAKGVPGVPGESGQDGLSAYEIALRNGFVGTEQEWLASLEGTNQNPILVDVTSTKYKGIKSTNGQGALEELYDLAIGDSNVGSATSLSISLLNNKIERLSLMPTVSNVELTISEYPIVNGQKLLILNNDSLSDLSISLPTENVVNGGITYSFKNIDTEITLEQGLSCEVNFMFIFINEVSCEIRITFINFI